MTTLAPTEWGFSENTSRIREWGGWNGLPAVLTSTPLNTCGMSLDMLFVPDWPVQPHWLTCVKCWLKNGMPSHSSVWPGWWTSMRRRCQAVVAVYGSSTRYWGSCLLNEWIVKLPIFLVSSDFNHPNNQTTPNKSQWQNYKAKAVQRRHVTSAIPLFRRAAFNTTQTIQAKTPKEQTCFHFMWQNMKKKTVDDMEVPSMGCISHTLQLAAHECLLSQCSVTQGVYMTLKKTITMLGRLWWDF